MVRGLNRKEVRSLIFQKQERLIHLHIAVLVQHLRAADVRA
jgi:hypothetical protein